MGKRIFIKRYNEVIFTKNRGTEDFFRNEFKLETVHDFSNILIKKEKILNELYRENGSLNNYVRSISNSIVLHSTSPRKGEEIVYFTDTNGRSRQIELPEICQMMRKKSYSLVTLEGIILLYSKKKLVCTLDSFTESSVFVEDIDPHARIINFVFIDYISKKTYINYTMKNGLKNQKEITFIFDFTAKSAPCCAVELNFC